MFFEDLSPYRYDLARPSIESVPNVLAVGWLENGHDFPVGIVSPSQISKLEHLIVCEPVNRMRGWHACGFCDPIPQSPLTIKTAKGNATLGVAEVWLPGESPTIYAAPNLVYHYILDHRYRPPEPFLAALDRLSIDAPLNLQAEFERRMQALYT